MRVRVEVTVRVRVEVTVRVRVEVAEGVTCGGEGEGEGAGGVRCGRGLLGGCPSGASTISVLMSIECVMTRPKLPTAFASSSYVRVGEGESGGRNVKGDR